MPPPSYAFTSCFLHVPRPEIKSAALADGADALANAAARPGRSSLCRKELTSLPDSWYFCQESYAFIPGMYTAVPLFVVRTDLKTMKTELDTDWFYLVTGHKFNYLKQLTYTLSLSLCGSGVWPWPGWSSASGLIGCRPRCARTWGLPGVLVGRVQCVWL